MEKTKERSPRSTASSLHITEGANKRQAQLNSSSTIRETSRKSPHHAILPPKTHTVRHMLTATFVEQSHPPAIQIGRKLPPHPPPHPIPIPPPPPQPNSHHNTISSSRPLPSTSNHQATTRTSVPLLTSTNQQSTHLRTKTTTKDRPRQPKAAPNQPGTNRVVPL